MTSMFEKEKVAESEGFEPPIPFRVCRFSRPVPSTTRPTLRLVQFYYSLQFCWTGCRGFFCRVAIRQRAGFNSEDALQMQEPSLWRVQFTGSDAISFAYFFIP